MDDGPSRKYIKLPGGDFGEEIRKKFVSRLYDLKVTILSACGNDAVTAFEIVP